MHMNTCLLSRKEEESKLAVTNNGGCHCGTVTNLISSKLETMRLNVGSTTSPPMPISIDCYKFRSVLRLFCGCWTLIPFINFRLNFAQGGWQGTRSPARVAQPLRGRTRLAGAHTTHSSISASTRWLARSLCGNGEWSLRLCAPPPAFVEVVGREQRGGIGLTPDLRLSDALAPKRPLEQSNKCRRCGSPIGENGTR